MTIYKELSFNDDVHAITGLQFMVMSPEEIRRRSVTEILTTNTFDVNEPIVDGLFDTRMGVIDNDKVCKTCYQRNTFCPGHFGHVNLCVPVFWIHFMDTVKKVLRCVCHSCAHMLVGLDDPRVIELMSRRISRQKRFELLVKMCARVRRCGIESGNGCGARQPEKVQKHNLGTIVMTFRPDPDILPEQLVRRLFAKDVLEILTRVSDDDAEALGFARGIVRPEYLLCQVFPVPPPAVRPSERNVIGQRCEDDLTTKLRDIVKWNNILAKKLEKGATPEQLEYTQIMLQYHVSTFVDNEIPSIAPAKQRTGRVLRSVTKRIKGKDGRIRGNLTGKRVDFSARSVITPDANIGVDELGVPLRIASNITYPETVNRYTFARLQALVRNGPDAYPGARYVRKRDPDGYRTMRVTDANRASLASELVYGDVVDRHMIDGDYVIFNRQPSLHKMSMMAHRVRVMPHHTFRLNVCVTASYNADFDGDEMNLHMPQSVQTETELIELCSVPTQVVSPRDSKPIVGIVQDVALGVFRMTRPGLRLSDREISNLLSIDPASVAAHAGNVRNAVDVLSTVIPSSVSARAKTNLHDTFVHDADGPDPTIAVVRRGRIESGRVDRKVFQALSKGLVHSVYNDMGPAAAVKMLDATQRIVCDFLVADGFSVGVSDIVIRETCRDAMATQIASMKTHVRELIRRAHVGDLENATVLTYQQMFEAELIKIVDETTKSVTKLAFDDVDLQRNRMLDMIHGGSKGNPINFAQMVALLGQQVVDNRRIEYGLEGRTLPHFPKYDDGPESRGFVESSFTKGLTPHEFFFHAIGGREGLIDTAVKTSETGYLQRKLVKAMEDCKVAYDMTVRNASGAIVQFLFGENGMSPTRLESHPTWFLEISHEKFEDEFLLFVERDDPRFSRAAWARARAAGKDDIEPINAELRRHFDDLRRDREFLTTRVFEHDTPSEIMFPVGFARILATAREKDLSNGTTDEGPLDAAPHEILDVIDRIAGLRVSAHDHGMMLGALARVALSPAQVLAKHRLSHRALEWVVERVHEIFWTSVSMPSEMVGVVAAQSIGEPSTQMTLNSVHYDTEMLFRIDGELTVVKIGEFIDRRIEGADEENLEHHPSRGPNGVESDLPTVLEYVRDRKVEVLACGEDGKVIWDHVEAVTRHPVINEDGSNALIRITLDSGRSVTCTKAKSVLGRVDNKIVNVDAKDLKIGDYVPVSNILPVDSVVDSVLLSEYLPKDTWLYMSEVRKALAHRDQLGGAGSRWMAGQGSVFTIPYKRSDSLLAAFTGDKPTRTQVRENCVYPRVQSSFAVSHMHEEFVLDELSGFFCGAYLAEGCCTQYNVLISNVDDDFNAKIEQFWQRYEITHHVDDAFKNNGYSKTLRSHSYVLTQFVLGMFGTGSGVKRIPAKLQAANEPFLKGLIDGYFSGDGSVSRYVVTADSISLGLLEDIQRILTRFEIQTTIQPQHNALEYNLARGMKAHLSYHMRISGLANARRFARTFSLTIKHKQDRLDEIKGKVVNAKHEFKDTDVIPNVVTEQWGTKTIQRSALKSMLHAATHEADTILLQSIQDEDVVYDKVVHLEEIPNDHDWVYDLTTTKTRNFASASGINLSDTFHASGTSAAVKGTQGVPRLKELLSVSRNVKSPSMTVYVERAIGKSVSATKSVGNTIVATYVRDVVRSTRVFYEPAAPAAAGGDEPLDGSGKKNDADAVSRAYLAYPELSVPDCSATPAPAVSPWYLDLILDKESMLERDVVVQDVQIAVLRQFGDRVACMFVDDNEPEILVRLRLRPESLGGGEDILTSIRALEHVVITSTMVKGVADIAGIEVTPVNASERNETTGAYDKVQSFLLHTSGSNLADVLAIPGVDGRRTISNNVHDIFACMGIEAARQSLMNEIISVLKNGGVDVNFHHISLLVDTMTSKGYLLRIDRHGINRSDIGPLAKCSFEETSDMLVKAGIFAEYDNMCGVSANIMLGQVPPCGTGDTVLLVDEGVLAEFVRPETASMFGESPRGGPNASHVATYASVAAGTSAAARARESITVDDIRFNYTLR